MYLADPHPTDMVLFGVLVNRRAKSLDHICPKNSLKRQDVLVGELLVAPPLDSIDRSVFKHSEGERERRKELKKDCKPFENKTIVKVTC